MSQSLAKECNEVKERYDTCFLKWYSEKYLRGVGSIENNECSELFNQYTKCLQGPLKARGIDKMLDEARDDNKENDIVYMGRKKCMNEYLILHVPNLILTEADQDPERHTNPVSFYLYLYCLAITGFLLLLALGV